MAIIVWNDGGSGSLWSTDANWVGGVAPIATDTVQFDATSIANSSCDISVAGVDIQGTYAGALTVVLAVALGAFSQAAGTFFGGTFALGLNSFDITGGVFNATSGALSIDGDWDNVVGVFNNNNGQIILTGNAVTQTINFGAASPHELIIARTGGIADFVSAFAATGAIREIAVANSTVRWLNAGAFSCDFIQTVGEGAFKTSNISSGAGNYQITVAELGVVNRHSGWANCDIIGAFIHVDLLTGSDDGGNDVTPPFGIEFANFPLNPLNFQGFGRLHKLGPEEIDPNIYQPPHKWNAEAEPIENFFVKNAIGEQVLNAIGEDVRT